MERNQSLHQILEVADLIAMIEEMVKPGHVEGWSPATWSGLRVTLRNSRAALLSSHDALAASSTSTADSTAMTTDEATSPQERAQRLRESLRGKANSLKNGGTSEPNRPGFTQRNLRSSLEKSVDQPNQ